MLLTLLQQPVTLRHLQHRHTSHIVLGVRTRHKQHYGHHIAIWPLLALLCLFKLDKTNTKIDHIAMWRPLRRLWSILIQNITHTNINITTHLNQSRVTFQ